jgi:hypothetical protein
MLLIKFLDENRLAHPGTAEEADLAALGIGRQQVDDLDAGDQDRAFGRLRLEGGRRLVDGARLLGLDRTLLVDRLADHVEDAPQRRVAHRHLDRRAGVGDRLAAHEALGRVHGDGAHCVLAQVLGHFQHQPLAVVVGLERVENRGQITLELHVDDGADHLGDLAGGFLVGHCFSLRFLRAPRRPK